MRSGQVSHKLFCAYMQGGRRWPQLRGGINIFLIRELLPSLVGSSSIYHFANSEFSQDQLRKIKVVMIQDHAKAGVVISREISDSLMNDEWRKAKASAIFSLHHFILQSDPIPGELHRVAQEISFSEKKAQQLFLNTQLHKLELQKVSAKAQEILQNHQDLASLYHLTNCETTQRHQLYHLSKDRYDTTLKRYGISKSIEDHPEIVKRNTLEIITQILKTNLALLSPSSNVGWICWGFEPYQKGTK